MVVFPVRVRMDSLLLCHLLGIPMARSLPLLRRGFFGTLRGPGLSLSGDNGSAQNGKYVSVQQLVGMTYPHRPSDVSIAAGSGMAQYFL